MKLVESNVQAAMAVLQHYTKAYGTTGAEGQQRMAVLSIFACLIGRGEATASDFAGVVRSADLVKLNDFNITFESPEPIAADGHSVLLSAEEHERHMAILSGLIFDSIQRNLTITEEAAAAARGPGDWPEAGIFVPFSTVVSAMEVGAGLVERDDDEGDDDDPVELVDDDGADEAELAATRRTAYEEELTKRTKVQLASIGADLGVKLSKSMAEAAMVAAILDSADLDYAALDASLANHPVA